MTDELPNFDLSGRTALVTGAARGLGRAAALALAAAGANIVLGVRDPGSATELADVIRTAGRDVSIATIDVTDLDPSLTAIDEALAEMETIDILVNNAGGSVPGNAIDATPQQFDEVISWNVKSSFFISQHIAWHMISKGRGGNIVNVSSQAALVALPGEPVYCLAKAAVSHMTRCLAVEWGPHGILVNAVCPTFIETPGTAPALSDAAFHADTVERIAALKRIGKPVEVSGAIVFLASPAASLITGHNLVIDGGWTVR